MYLHFLLTSDRSSLVATVFNQQVKGEGSKSWIQIDTKDLQELEINLSFSQISKITKGEFKDIVKKSCKKSCFEYLVKEKEKLLKG